MPSGSTFRWRLRHDGTLVAGATMNRPRLRHLIDFAERPLPVPPESLRRGPLRAGTFTSSLRSQRLTAQLGSWLGIAFGICFVTGLLSHFIAHPGWFWWPSAPVWLYRVTQGLHVATGFAIVPLLGAKLWSVYPKLFGWPPAGTLLRAIERGSIAVLVAAAVFQIVTGLLDTALWYTPMGFFFTTAHYFTGWLAIGALLVHVGVKLPIIRTNLFPTPPTGGSATEPPTAGLSRRGVLTAVATSAGVITLATVGQTIAPLSPVSVLGPRRPDQGPQGFPVNKSAQAAGVITAASDPSYRLMLVGPAGTRELSRAELGAMEQHTADLPISCVEGWSATARWTGVRIRDLATLAGVTGSAHVTVQSLQKGSLYTTSMLPPNQVADPLTLLALSVRGQPLTLDHGYPARIIAPNRPGVLQTKWVAMIRVEPA
jgi:DMSO/TMAO reductase YedYZ molybdopterin-dependent catalytic subunit